MYQTNEKFEEVILSPNRAFHARLIENDQVIVDNIKNFSMVSGNTEITIGSAIASYVEVTIEAQDLSLSGREVTLQTGLEVDGTVEYVPMGLFTIQNPKKESNKISFTAYDRLTSKCNAAYYSKLTYPVDALDILTEIEAMAGIEIDKTGISRGIEISKRAVTSESEEDVITTYVNPFDGYTYKETIGFVAGLFGTFAVCSRTGKVQFRWYTNRDYKICSSIFYNDLQETEEKFSLEKIVCDTADETIVSGDGTTGISMQNPVMTKSILDAIVERVKGLQYAPTELRFIGDIRLDVGDVVTVVKNDNTEIQLPVISIQTSYDGGLMQTIASYGNTAEEDDADTKGPIVEMIERVSYDMAIIKNLMTDNFTATNATIKNLSGDYADFKSVTTEDLKAIHAKIENLDVEHLDARYATIENLNATNANVVNLQAEVGTFKSLSTSKFEAIEGNIEKLTTEKLSVTDANIKYATIESLNAANAKIQTLDTEKLSAADANIKYATIESLNAANAKIQTLSTEKLSAADAIIKYATIESLNTANAKIQTLDTEKLSAKDADLKYANIEFSNIGNAAIENLFAGSGLIKDLVVGDQTITGELVGVTIKGDLIEGNTIVADKLVIKGEDGLYYKLNTNGVTTEAQQTEYNSLNGSIITAKSITATKIAVDDLVAFGATIGGFHITDKSIYSGVKTSATNTTRGIYLDKDGQIAAGDATNYLKYYKDQNGQYKLEISAGSISFGAGSKNLENEITNLYTETSTAQEKAEEAGEAAQTAQNVADRATQAAQTAADEAGKAQTAADSAAKAASDADAVAKAAQKDLDTAKANLTAVTNRVDATEEDIAAAQTAVSNAQAAADAAKANAATAQNAANAAQSTADIAKANASTAQNAANAAQTSATNAKTAADNAQKTADEAKNAVGNLSNTVTQMDTKIAQNAAAISLAATKKEVEDKLSGYSTTAQMNSAISVSASGILNTVSGTYTTKEDFNNLNIGGRNIASQTNKGADGWGWNFGGGGGYTKETVVENNIQCAKLTRNDVEVTSWNYIYYNKILLTKFAASTEYTISFEVKSSVQSWFYVFIQHGNSTGSLFKSKNVINSECTANEWSKIVVTGTTQDELPGLTDQLLYLTTTNTDPGTWYIFRNLKIEKGNKATDWTPAPEDIDEEFKKYSTTEVMNSSIQQAANSIKLDVAATYTTKSEFNSMQIGGRNYVIGSSTADVTDWKMSGWTRNTFTTYSASERTYKLVAEPGWVNAYYVVDSSLASNIVTLSFYAKCLSEETTATDDYGLYLSNSSATDPYLTNDLTGSKPTQDEWMRLQITFTLNKGHQFGIAARCTPEGVNLKTTWLIKDVKLEKGNKATDWSPAPEDTEEEIKTINASLELKIDTDKLVSVLNASADIIHLKGNRFIVESDNFNLTADGTMTAKNGTFTGNITATSGKIGRYNITETYLKTGSGSSATGIGGDQAFWAGADDANSAPFRVGYNGAVAGSNFDVSGTFKATGSGTDYSGNVINFISTLGANGLDVVGNGQTTITSSGIMVIGDGTKYGIDRKNGLVGYGSGLRVEIGQGEVDFNVSNANAGGTHFKMDSDDIWLTTDDGNNNGIQFHLSETQFAFLLDCNGNSNYISYNGYNTLETSLYTVINASLKSTSNISVDGAFYEAGTALSNKYAAKSHTHNAIWSGSYGVKFTSSNNFKPCDNGSDDNYDNKVACGTTSSRWTRLYAGNASISTSDERMKENIRTFDERYEKLFDSLEPVTYLWKNDGSDTRDDHDRIHTGFIAQQVKNSMDQAGLTVNDFAAFCYDDFTKDPEWSPDSTNGFTDRYSLAYEEFISLNTHMIQKTRAEMLVQAGQLGLHQTMLDDLKDQLFEAWKEIKKLKQALAV